MYFFYEHYFMRTQVAETEKPNFHKIMKNHYTFGECNEHENNYNNFPLKMKTIYPLKMKTIYASEKKKNSHGISEKRVYVSWCKKLYMYIDINIHLWRTNMQLFSLWINLHFTKCMLCCSSLLSGTTIVSIIDVGYIARRAENGFDLKNI